MYILAIMICNHILTCDIDISLYPNFFHIIQYDVDGLTLLVISSGNHKSMEPPCATGKLSTFFRVL